MPGKRQAECINICMKYKYLCSGCGKEFFKNYKKINSRKVYGLTKKVKSILFENWNGNDYYDGTPIKDTFRLFKQHGDYPSILQSFIRNPYFGDLKIK